MARTLPSRRKCSRALRVDLIAGGVVTETYIVIGGGIEVEAHRERPRLREPIAPAVIMSSLGGLRRE